MFKSAKKKELLSIWAAPGSDVSLYKVAVGLQYVVCIPASSSGAVSHGKP